MANTTMNIASATWSGVTFDERATVTLDFGGDMVEHSAGIDTHISTTQVVAIRGVVSLTTNSRITAASLFGKINTEAELIVQIKDTDAATGIRITIKQCRLQRVQPNGTHNTITDYTATFYARSSNGILSPVTVAAY